MNEFFRGRNRKKRSERRAIDLRAHAKRKRASLGMPAPKYRPILTEKPTPGRRLRPARRRNRLVFAIRLRLLRLSALADVDAALEERAIFNGDARRDHVAGQRPIAANIHAVAGGQIPPDFAQHHNLPRINVGSNHSIAADRHSIAREVDRSLHAPINVERLRARHFALNNQRLANRGLVRRGRAQRSGSGRFTRRRSHGWRAGRGHSGRSGSPGRAGV